MRPIFLNTKEEDFLKFDDADRFHNENQYERYLYCFVGIAVMNQSHEVVTVL